MAYMSEAGTRLALGRAEKVSTHGHHCWRWSTCAATNCILVPRRALQRSTVRKYLSLVRATLCMTHLPRCHTPTSYCLIHAHNIRIGCWFFRRYEDQGYYPRILNDTQSKV